MSRDLALTVNIVVPPSGYGKIGELAAAMPNRSWVKFDGTTQYGVACTLPTNWVENFASRFSGSSFFAWGGRGPWNPVAKACEWYGEGSHASTPGYVWLDVANHSMHYISVERLGNGTVPTFNTGHMYDMWACNPTTGEIYAGYYVGNESTPPPYRRFAHGVDPDTVASFGSAPHPRNITGETEWWTGSLNGVGAQGALVTVSNIGGGWVDIYDPLAAGGAGQWSSISIPGISPPTLPDSHSGLGAYSEIKNCFVFGCRNAFPRQFWRMNSDMTVTKYATLAPADCNIYVCTFVADPITGKFLALRGSNAISPPREFWEFDPALGGTWTQLPLPTPITDELYKDGNGRDHGAVSIPIPGVGGVIAYFMHATSSTHGLWLYKHGP